MKFAQVFGLVLLATFTCAYQHQTEDNDEYNDEVNDGDDFTPGDAIDMEYQPEEYDEYVDDNDIHDDDVNNMYKLIHSDTKETQDLPEDIRDALKPLSKDELRQVLTQDDFDEKRGQKKSVQDPWRGRRRRRWFKRVVRKVHRFVRRNVQHIHRFIRIKADTINQLKRAVRICCNYRLCKGHVCRLAG